MSDLAERLLPWVNDIALRPANRRRRELLSHAHGDVLELGFGSGLNAALYPSAVDRIVAVEPSAPMWAVGEKRAAKAGVAVERVDAFGEDLPLPDDSVDVAVSTFVLCSVRDPDAVLNEMARVVRPGGSLLIFEHVEHPAPTMAAVQQAITPVWRTCFAGCHPGRCLDPHLHASPWEPEDVQDVDLHWLPPVIWRHRIARYRIR